jgi:iron complex transport system permease protein
MLLLAAGVLFVSLFSLCVKTTVPGLIAPGDALRNLYEWIHLSVSRAQGGGAWARRFEIIDGLGGSYYDSISRFLISIITFACGMMLALSGNIFQSVFRNPIAAPSMLGVASGVQVGIIVLVLRYEFAAEGLPLEKYKYCYFFALAMLALVLVAAKLSSGSKKFSVFDLLIVAAIVQAIIGGVTSFFTYGMDNDLALALQNVSNAVRVNTEPISLYVLGAVFLISVIPFFLLRFSFNAVCFDSDESGSMGVNTRLVKFVSLALGSLMMTAGMVHCGSVGMISLIVPFIARAVFGAESKKLFWGNLLIGGLILLICRDIAAFIPFAETGLPIGAVVQFVAMPVFVLILFSGRRTWE